MAKYIIRFDDFYVGMERGDLIQARDTITRLSISAIVGVVPNWQDEAVVEQRVGEEEFWQTIKLLHEHGCEIALHGYSHKLFKHENLLGVNLYGEFSGLEYAEQKSRIEKGLSVFKQHNIQCRMFMPPAHSFDKNTILALKDSDISLVTDGKSFYPYKYEDVLFLPQISSRFKNYYPFGIITICLHPQWMSSNNYKELTDFCLRNGKNIVNVQFAVDVYKTMSNINRWIDSAIRQVYFLVQRIKTV